MEIAKGLIASREHSRWELRRKLATRGLSEHAGAVVDRLVAADLLDDERFARAWLIARLGRKQEGRQRLAAELTSRGVDRSLADRVLADQFPEEDELSTLDACAARLRRAGGSPEALHRRLLSRGFPASAVRRVLEADHLDR